MSDKITKFLQSLDQRTRNRLKKKLTELKAHPESYPGVVKITGRKNTFRIRIGTMRILYTYISQQITIIDIDFRKDIYRKF